MKKSSVISLFSLLAFFIATSSATGEILFGPTQYFRTKGSADVYTDTFSATPGTATLLVANGDPDGSYRVSSALIFINGQEIFGTEDFKQGVYILKAPIDLTENNSITVKIKKAKTGGYLTIQVTRGVAPPTVTISGDPEMIQVGESSTLTWSSTNADSCVIEPDIGSVDANGSSTVSPTETTTYTITATGPAGTATSQTVVTVTGGELKPDDPFVAQYWDLIPPDATADYDTKRFSIITGLVQDLNSFPLTDVSITIHGHVEYGTAATDADGRFSIPVEGGGIMIVVYQKQGLINAHRKVHVPWNEIAIAETIQMIAQDPISTEVTFDGNPETVVTHHSTEVSDESGTRSCATVFTGDNLAYEVDVDGNVIGELTTITTRATEFTTPESMPAKLPPNSAYTYCAELGVDGAERVRFEKPVITWVNNFLGFDVGSAVPVGGYDRDRGVWVPADNGVVVELLDTDTDGVVDAIDATGNGQPDDLNGNSSFIDEVRGLDNPMKYQPGATFWRVAISHFTPWDCNWPYGPPADAIPPNPRGEPDTDQQEPYQVCQTSTGSFAEDRTRILHEDIPIPGTDMTLHYASSRVEGYKTVISVPASGDTVPASLHSIIVEMNVAGRTFTKVVGPMPNQRAEFVWDGLDFLGEPVFGRAIASLKLGFVYPAYYMTPGDFQQAFGQTTSGTITGIRARHQIVFWNQSKSVIEISSPYSAIAEGWTLSAHHFSEPKESIIYRGDGTTLKNNIDIIERVAGTGADGNSGDGGPALEAELEMYFEFTIDASGCIYLTDRPNNSIRKIDSAGVITTIAGGNKKPGYSGDGGPAIRAKLNGPNDIESDAAGNLYFIDGNNCVVRKIDTEGVITTVAGNGTCGYSGDGGPAVDATLEDPDGLALDSFGNIYIIGTIINNGLYSYRIRKIDSGGIINTIAEIFSGTNPYFYYFTSDLVVDAYGNIYFCDWVNSRVRKIDQEGNMTIVAGNGGYHHDFLGDGGPATQAPIGEIYDITLDASGNLYIAVGNFYITGPGGMIKKVDHYGIITTIAGTGIKRISGDGDLAAEANMDLPVSISFDPLGNLFIGDRSTIRKIANGSDRVFPDDNGFGYIMSSAGQHEKTIDLDSGVTLLEFGYDGNNKLHSMSDQFGNQTAIPRDSSGVPFSIISQDGIITNLTIDANNHLTRITYPDGNYYDFEYTPDGLMTAKIEPEGNRFEHVFDANGKLTNATDEELGHWQFTKTALSNGDILTEVLTGEGSLTSYMDHTYSTGEYTSTITDPTGAQTLFERSADGLTVNKYLACGTDLGFKYGLDPEYKFKYVREMEESTPSALDKITLRSKTYEDTDSDDTPDLITETVTVNDKTATLENDVLQSQKTITTPEGRAVSVLYNPDTLMTESVSVPGLFDTSYRYDIRGRLTSVDTNTRGIDLTYNSRGFLESVTDPKNHTTYYTYDEVGRVKRVDRPDNTSVCFSYDNHGNMTVLTNPSTIDHGFGYNRVNLSSSYQTPLSGSYSYVYDKDKRLTQITFPSGNQINNIYDKTRLAQIQTPQGNIDVTYLCSTKVGSIAKGTESITYGYDGKLLTSEALSGTLNLSLSYSYNNDFNLQSSTYAGNTHIYTYDNDGLLTGAGNFTITRNAGNGLPEAVTGNALNLTRTFNGYAEVEAQDFTVSGHSLTSWNLTRDDNGRITNKAETVDGATSNYVYTYDPMGRILTVTKDGVPVEEYQYGPNGTRTYEMNSLRGIAGRTFNYSAEDHLLTAGNTSYQYDLDGFLTTKTDGTDITQYAYSSRGELLSVILPDGTFIEYVHDPLGRRIAKKVNGITVEKYLWQGLTRLLALYDGSNNLLMRFEYADARTPIAMTMGDSTYYLTHDQVGSLRVVADAASNVVKRIDYDSFGNIISDTDPSFDIRFGFAGGLHDRDTGLVRFGYRDYDPDVGRWTAKDPIFFAGGDTDLYGYCLNDPIRFIDPWGLINLVEAYAEMEGAIKPYVVGGALVVTGSVTAVAGGTTTVLGYGSIPETGPAGALVGTIGELVTVVGAAQFTLGLDVYADELRRRLGLPEWFDVIPYFELFTTQKNQKDESCK
jgi:RHS repeat-associated protein